MVKLYRLGDVTEDYVQGELKTLAKERDDTQAKLNLMVHMKQTYTPTQLMAKLISYCVELKQIQSEMTFQDKRTILTALGVSLKLQEIMPIW